MDTAARRLRDALEPVAMHAVWSASTRSALGEHGLDFLQAYVCGRGAALGDTPSAVLVATFAVFDPGLIDAAWSARPSDLTKLIRARDTAASASLRAVIGDADEAEVARVAGLLEDACAGLDATGRPLFAALRAQPRLPDAYGRLWRAADVVREHRGDSHVAACVAAGLEPVAMNVLTELRVGYPLGEYTDTRGWPVASRDAAVARLEADGLVADGALTGAGQMFRDGLEATTDAAQSALVAALGDAVDDVIGRLDAWSALCIAAGEFPEDARKRAAG